MEAIATIPNGKQPRGMKFKRDGSRTTGAGRRVAAIGTLTLKLLRNVRAGQSRCGMAFTPDSRIACT